MAHYCIKCMKVCECHGDTWGYLIGTLDDCTHCDDQFAIGGSDRADEPDDDDEFNCLDCGTCAGCVQRAIDYADEVSKEPDCGGCDAGLCEEGSNDSLH